MRNIYSNLYNKKEKRLDLSNNPRIQIMSDIVNELNLKGKNILDIGCYDGTFLSLIKNRNNNFYGIDASKYGIREALKKKIKAKLFFFDDRTKIPFRSGFFDLIIAGEIIEHIYDTDFFLEEIYRLLKKDGFLLISTPNIASLGRRLMLLLGVSPIIEISPNRRDSSGHIRYFTFRDLESLLETHRFSVVLKQSDVINFTSNGVARNRLLAKIFPHLGQSIIFLLRKVL